jgi:hypothetical protein
MVPRHILRHVAANGLTGSISLSQGPSSSEVNELLPSTRDPYCTAGTSPEPIQGSEHRRRAERVAGAQHTLYPRHGGANRAPKSDEAASTAGEQSESPERSW